MTHWILTTTMAALTWLAPACGANAEQERAPAEAQRTGARQTALVDPNRFAVIVAGVGGEEAYSRKFTGLALSMYDALTGRLGFGEEQVFLLTENVAGGPENGSLPNAGRSTAEGVTVALNTIKERATAESLVLIVLIGHGSFDSQEAKFNLVGRDLNAGDYAALMAGIPGKVVFVNCASSSGEFIKPLSGENRIIITATRSGNEQNATVFAEHFAAALTDEAADADKNGRLSLLEVFSYATRMVADFYKQENRLATEHALIDDNGDGVGHEEAKEGDGALAKTLYLDVEQLELAAGDAELTRLLKERQRLEEEIEKLKAGKAEMKEDEYESELERLLVELATVNRVIRERRPDR